MQQPHYNKDLDVRQIGPEDLPRARLVAGRAFTEHAEDWYGEDETALAGFDGEGTLVCALGYQLESLWWGAAQIPAGAIGGVATDPKHKRRGHAGGRGQTHYRARVARSFFRRAIEVRTLLG